MSAEDLEISPILAKRTTFGVMPVRLIRLDRLDVMDAVRDRRSFTSHPSR
jgi:hypothetical protein